jgi:hypothetical protein
LETYVPSDCYEIKSGKSKGKVLERLMFQNYSWILWQLSFIRKKGDPDRKKNQMERHLEEILKRGENRETTAICPQCKESCVSYLSVIRSPYGISAGIGFTCCDNESCIRKVEGMAMKTPEFLPFRFSILKTFSNKSDQKIIAGVLKWGFGLKKFTKKELFALFWE